MKQSVDTNVIHTLVISGSFEGMDPEDRPGKELDNFVTLTIRLIRSFEHRNIKFLVLKNVDLSWSTEQLIEKTFDEIRQSSALPKPFKTFQYDTMMVREDAKFKLNLKRWLLKGPDI